MLVSDISPSVLFPHKPLIHFYPEVDSCSLCGEKLNTQKTWIKTVVTMDIGAFHAKETQLECPKDREVFTSQQLRMLVPAQCTFGFDVIVYVGMSLFVHSRNNQEIMKDLAARNISISEREISYLGRKFVIYLAIAHRENSDQLRGLLAKQGGYILHVDGTCEGDSPNLFCGLDGISELVLGAIKIPSEKKEQLIPFFQDIKKRYGNPIAMVHDMGTGILAALAIVFPGIADFICHFHFLRDIGKDLLLADYQIIIKCLRTHNVRILLRQKSRYLENKIKETTQTISHFKEILDHGELKAEDIERIPAVATYLLINWAFEFSSDSQGYGFPFDRPHLDFCQRLKEIHHRLEDIRDSHHHNQIKERKPFLQVSQLLEGVINDNELNEAIARLKSKAEVFDKLREALQIALPDGKNGLNDNGDEKDIKTIEKKVSDFKEWLTSDKGRKNTYAKMIEQIEKYWSKLFADPIVVNAGENQAVIIPQRTNNILERFFRNEKKRNRRRSGTVSLNKTLKTILADTPLINNLKNEKYMQIILKGCASLEERLSQIDAKLVIDNLKQAQNNQEKISPEVRKLIKQPKLPEVIFALFDKYRKTQANCHLRL
jgi:hypothetical protein